MCSSDLNQPKWFAALDAVDEGRFRTGVANGNIVCRMNLTNPGLIPGCLPWNPFGNGSPSAALVRGGAGGSLTPPPLLAEVERPPSLAALLTNPLYDESRPLHARLYRAWRNYLAKPFKRSRFGALGHRVVTSRQWGTLIVVGVVINTIILCLDGYPVNRGRQEKVELANFVLTIFFAADVVAKLSAEGLVAFFRDGWCTFDLLVVLASVAELGVVALP